MKKLLTVCQLVILLTGMLGAEVSIWCIGDSRKVTFYDDKPQVKNYIWDASSKTVNLKSARNEYTAFQAVLKNDVAITDIKAEISDFGSGIKAELFKEFYVDCLGDKYPDALIPFVDPYSGKHETIVSSFDLERKANQPIWVDIFVPEDAKPGEYKALLKFTAKDIKEEINVITMLPMPCLEEKTRKGRMIL